MDPARAEAPQVVSPSAGQEIEAEGYRELGIARGGPRILEFLEREIGSLTALNVLDLGCGFGGISLALAAQARHVTSVDYKFEPELQHLAGWARKRGVRNLRVVNASALQLPFSSHAFDLVVVNGMLEWIGRADARQNPEALQRQALREIIRVLRPGGVLYLAIENRFYPAYLLRDPHTHVPLVSFLPRLLADWLSYAIDRRRYDVYTHSSWHLGAMLRQAGFGETRFYLPVTSYYYPVDIARMDDTSSIRRLLNDLDRKEGAAGREPQFAELTRGRYHRPKMWFWKAMVGLHVQRVFAGAFVILAAPRELPVRPRHPAEVGAR